MFSAALVCKKCGYATEKFRDGYDIYDKTWTVICHNAQTGAVRIASVPKEFVDDSEAKKSASTFTAALDKFALRPGETSVWTALGVSETLKIKCPNCHATELYKEVVGIA